MLNRKTHFECDPQMSKIFENDAVDAIADMDYFSRYLGFDVF